MSPEARRHAAAAVRLAFPALAAWAAFATGFLGAERAFRAGPAVSLLAGVALAGLVLGVVLLGGDRVARALGAFADRAGRVPVPAWLAGCVALATGLRLAWAAVLSPRQVSDMELYNAYARSLAERGLDLTHAEISTLVVLDPRTLESFANALDPRLQKASLRASVAVSARRLA